MTDDPVKILIERLERMRDTSPRIRTVVSVSTVARRWPMRSHGAVSTTDRYLHQADLVAWLRHLASYTRKADQVKAIYPLIVDHIADAIEGMGPDD